MITVLYIQLSPLGWRLVHGNHGAPEIVDVPSELAVLIFEPRDAFPQPVCFTRNPLRRSANPPYNVLDAVSVTNAALSAALPDPPHLGLEWVAGVFAASTAYEVPPGLHVMFVLRHRLQKTQVSIPVFAATFPALPALSLEQHPLLVDKPRSKRVASLCSDDHPFQLPVFWPDAKMEVLLFLS